MAKKRSSSKTRKKTSPKEAAKGPREKAEQAKAAAKLVSVRLSDVARALWDLEEYARTLRNALMVFNQDQQVRIPQQIPFARAFANATQGTTAGGGGTRPRWIVGCPPPGDEESGSSSSSGSAGTPRWIAGCPPPIPATKKTPKGASGARGTARKKNKSSSKR